MEDLTTIEMNVVYSRQNARHVEDFSIQVSQIAHNKNEDGLDDTHLVGKTSEETREEAQNDADECTTERNHNKGGETRQNVGGFDVFCADTNKGAKHLYKT